MEKKTTPKIGFVHTGVPIGMMLKKMMRNPDKKDRRLSFPMPANKFSDSLKSIKRKPISAEILHMITDNILAGNLKPGDKLPTEFELAESLGVGRNSVREAIKMLHSLGVVEVKMGAGTFIAGP